MRVMSAGDGYKYPLKTVVAADGNRPLSTPLTRYYMEEGTPPGRWLGAGVAALGKGGIQARDRVSEDQLQLLMGTGCDPITGDKLGLGFAAYKSQDERIEGRIAVLDQTLTPGAKGEATRGRHGNHAYVTLDRADDHAQPHQGDDPHATAGSVLYGVL